MTEPHPRARPFLETKEYRRFAEFCDACRRDRYIGLCYGPPGVGKTLSARHYARWDEVEPLLRHARGPEAPPPDPAILDCQTLFYTVSMITTPLRLEQDITRLMQRLNVAIGAVRFRGRDRDEWLYEQLTGPPVAELLIVDEADRLTFRVLEQLRHVYDQAGVGLVLIGMPGLEKRLARYPQLY